MQTNHQNFDLITSSSADEYNVLSSNDPSSEDKPTDDCTQVLYIDEDDDDDDDERSVSLKSFVSDSRTSSGTILTKKNHSQTFSLSSSSSICSNDCHSNPMKIHESSV